MAKSAIHKMFVASSSWFKEGLSEVEFFERWRTNYHNHTSSLHQRRIGYSRKWRAARSKNEQYRIARRAIAKAWRDKNLEKSQANIRASYHRHAEQRRAGARAYRQSLKLDPIKYAEHKRKTAARRKFREDNDLHYRIRRRVRGRVKMAIDKHYKTGSGLALLGCSIPEFKAHIERQWTDGMCWMNYGRGGWEIDHIKPCASFDLTDPEQQKICFHYSNTRPLWGIQNRSKGAILNGRNFNPGYTGHSRFRK